MAARSKFKAKDAEYAQTFFVSGHAIRLEPGQEYETDDAALIAELQEHHQLEQVKAVTKTGGSDSGSSSSPAPSKSDTTKDKKSDIKDK